MALQGEEILELIYDPLDDLPFAGSPATGGLRPSPSGVVLGGGRYQCSVVL
jgi:hypothetical protein